MNKEKNHIIIEVLNSNGDIKLTKMRNPQAIWQNNKYPDERIFKDVDYVNIFSLIQERDKYKSIVEKAISFVEEEIESIGEYAVDRLLYSGRSVIDGFSQSLKILKELEEEE